MCQAVPPGDASRGPGNAIGGFPSPDPAPAVQAAAPSDPAARGAGNTFGSTSGVPASGTNGIPLGANAALAPGAGQHSFADQGYSGVGTPLGVAYGTAPQAAPTVAAAPDPSIHAPRYMDTGPLFGSAITTPAQTPATTPAPSAVAEASPVSTTAAPSMELFDPKPMDMGGSMLPPIQNIGSSANYAAPATPSQGSASVVNALLRRRINQGGYY